MARDPKHDILFEPIQIGPKTMKNRFYQIPHCNGFGSEKPMSQAYFRAMKAEGGYAGGLHRVLLDPPRVRRHAPRLGAPLGRRRHQEPRVHVRHAPRARRARRRRALVRRPARALHGDALRPARALADPERLRVPDLPEGDGQGRHPDGAGLLRRGRQAGTRGRLRHRLRLRLALLPPAAVPDAVLQPAHGRVRRLLREPRALLARDDRAGARGRRRRLRDRRPHVDRHVHGRGRHAARARLPAVRRDVRRDRRRLGHQRLRHLRVGRGRDAVALLRVRAACSRGRRPSRRGEEARARRRPLHEPRPDGRGDRVRARSTSSPPAARPSPIPSCRARSTRAASTTSASASAATSASRAGRSAARRSSARRTRPPARSTAAAGIPSASTQAENADNDVLVVGAGPAGMECAMVLGKRGMRRVHLVEASDDMGGIMRWIPQLPGLGEWARVVNYRKIQIDKLKNVEFIPNTKLDADGVKEYGAEIVIVATGGYWATDGLNGCTHDTIPGADASLPWQLDARADHGRGQGGARRAGRHPRQRRLLHGRLPRGEARQRGQEGHAHDATSATSRRTCTSRSRRRTSTGSCTSSASRSSRTTCRRKFEEGRVLASHVYDEDGHEHEFEADAVVLVTQRRSNEALYRELKDTVGLDALAAEGISGFYRIGDCEAPRLTADAIFSGPPARPGDRHGRSRDAAPVQARAAGRRARGARCLKGCGPEGGHPSSGLTSVHEDRRLRQAGWSPRRRGRVHRRRARRRPRLPRLRAQRVGLATRPRRRSGSARRPATARSSRSPSGTRTPRTRCAARSPWAPTAACGSGRTSSPAPTRSPSRGRWRTSSGARAPTSCFAGVQSSDAVQAATGAALAELLDLPRVAVVTKLELGSGTAEGRTASSRAGSIDVVEVDTPAVLTIQTGINEPRYATLRAIKQAEQKEIEVREPGDLGTPASRVRRMFVPPQGRGRRDARRRRLPRSHSGSRRSWRSG